MERTHTDPLVDLTHRVNRQDNLESHEIDSANHDIQIDSANHDIQIDSASLEQTDPQIHINTNQHIPQAYTPHSQYNPYKVDLVKVVFKSVLLGSILLINLIIIAFNYGGFIDTPRWIPLNFYFIFLAFYHLMEFLSTALFNNRAVDDDSFILEDWDMHWVTVASVVEYVIRTWLGWNVIHWISFVGVLVAVAGQFVRTLAMYTACESFNHYIQRHHEAEKHRLVTHGIYAILRHPSYFGFWWWYVGLQLYLNNVILGVVGGYILCRFFKKRVEFEEELLVTFFTEYDEYRNRTRTGIPFVK